MDSLKNLLKTPLPDTAKVLLLNKIGTAYLYSSTDTSFIYIQQALSISEQINFPLGVALAQHRLANIYRLQGNYPEALKNGFEALKIYTDLQVRSNIAGVQNALGGIYFRLEDYDKALSYFQQSLNHYEALGDELGKANQFVSLGNVYKNKNQGEKALDYYFKALAVNRKSGKKLAVSINLENIGSLYIAQKKYDEALPYLFESLEISTEIKDQQGITSISRHIADIYLHNGQTQKSMEYAEMSLGVASKNKLKIEAAAASLILSKNYSSLGDFQKALEFYQLHVAYKDSLYSAEKLKELNSLENRYEIQQKEQELEIQAQRMALLNRDKEINRIWRNILAASLLILVLLGILVYKLQRLKNQKNKQLLLTQQSVTQKLQELDKSKSRFFANISHEFRTPLTLILGPIKEMEDGHFSGDPKPVFSMVRRNAQRLLYLVNQLLDLSKIEAGKMQLQAAEYALVPFLETIAASYHSLAEHKHIEFEVCTDLPQIKLYFDRDKLENVLHNLLSNAFKFTARGGKVSLIAVAGKPQVEIKVEDNGRGIPAKQLPKIFDRFYQVDNSHTREGEGTGIGLALAKELVELHHGKISVTSIEGQGANFTIQLPLGKSHLSPDEIMQAVPGTDYLVDHVKTISSSRGEDDQIGRTSSSQEILHGPQILVVEDHHDMRRFINSILSSGYKVDLAADGLEGWEKAIETLPDLILSDVMMPKLDGVELCQKLKDDERTSHIPVILLTAKADKSSKMEGLQTGADDYLAKPFDAEELLLLIGNRIAQRKKLRERFSREVTLQPKDIAITSADERFLEKAIAIVEEHMDDTGFNVKAFVQEMPLGHMQVHRKLEALTDQSPVQFIRFLRLKRAAAKISQREDTISQIAYSVGFNNLSYFAHCFKQQFGCSPSEYAHQEVE